MRCSITRLSLNFVLAGFLLLVMSCQNFDYTNPLCFEEIRVDIPGFTGNFYQFDTVADLTPIPTNLDVTNYKLTKKEIGRYIRDDEGTQKEVLTCRIRDRVLVEWVENNRRYVFQYDPLPDGFVLTSLGIRYSDFEASRIPFESVKTSTIVADTNGVLQVDEKAGKADDDSKSFLINTSQMKTALQLADILRPTKDAQRFFHGVRK